MTVRAVIRRVAAKGKWLRGRHAVERHNLGDPGWGRSDVHRPLRGRGRPQEGAHGLRPAAMPFDDLAMSTCGKAV